MSEPWPITEARKIVARRERTPSSAPVLLETGFGPSGLPHIGTFAEVARTTFVRTAFRDLTDDKIPTRLVVFSDDMDGLRSVPLSVPNPGTITPHLGRPLVDIPDPFGEDPSYADHMNRRLREFLDQFGFDYEFVSSAATYRAGRFNEILHLAAERHDAITERIARTMRKENRDGYSPFLPTCPSCGRNLTGGVVAVHPESDELEIECRDQQKLEGCGFAGRRSYLDGGAKLRWKADWALRWTALSVDYEMFGKDLNDTVSESRAVCEILGGSPPAGMFYEMMLDADGAKISKSIGKGLTVDQWAKWAPVESLLCWLYPNPRRARRLYADVVPAAVDDYLAHLGAWAGDGPTAESNPIPFFRDLLRAKSYRSEVTFALVRSVVAVLGGHDETLVYETIARGTPPDPADAPLIQEMVRHAIAFEADTAGEGRRREAPEAAADRALVQTLAEWVGGNADADAEEIQKAVFRIAQEAERKPPELFRLIYRGLIGIDRGPRVGTLTLVLGHERMARELRALASGEIYKPAA